MAARLLPVSGFFRAAGKAADVCLFLAGMMLLSEVARRDGIFEWIARRAARAAQGSRMRLFLLIYGAGTLVTIFLSNDATAVVLTPAVAAAARAAKAPPMSYVLACAFVANAASFVLPISNPANLVVFAGAMPPLARWLGAFTLPSLLSIAATFAALAWISRRELRTNSEPSPISVPPLGTGGRVTFVAIGLTAILLLTTSALGAPLGPVTAVCGVIVYLLACARDRAAFREVPSSVSWSVLPLVVGLFALVESLDATGLLAASGRLAHVLAGRPAAEAVLAAALLTAIASNLMNNLPSGLIAGASVASLHGHEAFRSAVAVGIDLSPNLSVTGSLATMLWLIALRREGIEMNAGTFLRAGAVVMPPALLLASLGVTLTTR